MHQNGAWTCFVEIWLRKWLVSYSSSSLIARTELPPCNIQEPRRVLRKSGATSERCWMFSMLACVDTTANQPPVSSPLTNLKMSDVIAWYREEFYWGNTSHHFLNPFVIRSVISESVLLFLVRLRCQICSRGYLRFSSFVVIAVLSPSTLESDSQ